VALDHRDAQPDEAPQPPIGGRSGLIGRRKALPSPKSTRCRRPRSPTGFRDSLVEKQN
jgi:hypothetical protein